MTTDSPIEFRDVPGQLGYRVGSDGSVWSRWTYRSLGIGRGTTWFLGQTWHTLKPIRTNKWGHLRVNLQGGSQRLVHHLVLEAFVGPCPPGMECCHGDGNPANNSIRNLRWDTPAANKADMVRHGTSCRGQRNGQAKLTDEAVVEIRRLHAAGTSTQDLADRFGVSRRTAGRAISGKGWSHVRSPKLEE